MNSLLFSACESGDCDLVSKLLEQDVDSDVGSKLYDEYQYIFGYTPLISASYYGHDTIVQMLLQRGHLVDTKCKIGRTALSYAVEQGHVKVITLLIQHGANVNLADDLKLTPLLFAIYFPDEILKKRMVNLLLESGADIGFVWSPLRVASCVQLLLRECPNVNFNLVNPIGTNEWRLVSPEFCKLLSQAAGRKPIVSLHSKLRLY